jgi:hypothetical protein
VAGGEVVLSPATSEETDKAQPQDPTITADHAPEGETAAIYDADDNLELDAGPEPRDGGLDHQHGTKTRQARKNEISNRPV